MTIEVFRNPEEEKILEKMVMFVKKLHDIACNLVNVRPPHIQHNNTKTAKMK